MKNQILFRKKCFLAFLRTISRIPIQSWKNSFGSFNSEWKTFPAVLQTQTAICCENPHQGTDRPNTDCPTVRNRFPFCGIAALFSAVLFLCFTTGCENEKTVPESPAIETDVPSAAIPEDSVSKADDSQSPKDSRTMEDIKTPDPEEGNGENDFSFDENEEFTFGEGEDFDLGEAEGQVSQEELDKYIEDEEYMFAPLKLDEPIFEDPSELVRFHPEKPIWVDKKRENVVLQGWVCQKRAMLEFFLCQGTGGIRTFPYEDETGKPATMLMFNGTKCHESVLCADVPGHFIHTALLALGAEPGKPVQFQPEFIPPTGEEIEILVRWKNEEGETVEMRGQDLVADSEGNPMRVPWVFAGSLFYEDGEGNRRYAAEMEGEFFGVSNFPSCILDVPQASSSSNEALVYVANEKTLPERGTPVTLILRKAEKKGTKAN